MLRHEKYWYYLAQCIISYLKEGVTFKMGKEKWCEKIVAIEHWTYHRNQHNNVVYAYTFLQ